FVTTLRSSDLSFALIKLSVYSLVGIVSDNPKEHSSLLSSIEGFFMVGIASAYFLFPIFYSETQPHNWLKVYLVLSALVLISLLFLSMSNIRIEAPTAGANWRDDIKNSLKLIWNTLVLVFLFYAFFFVMIERSEERR